MDDGSLEDVEIQIGHVVEMFKTKGESLVPRGVSQAVDAVTVFLSEEEAPVPGIDRETPEHGFSNFVGERDDDTRHPRGVDRQGPAEVEAGELTRPGAERAGAQHYQAAPGDGGGGAWTGKGGRPPADPK